MGSCVRGVCFGTSEFALTGGCKYVIAGIVFKLALDNKRLYGSHENAAKAAGHELKGAIAAYSVLKRLRKTDQLRVPMQVR